MHTIRLVLATNNQHKVKEIRKILPESYDLLTLKDAGLSLDLPETTGSISGNAAQKALTVWELTGCDCIADDSGLEVQALDGKPGVDSAHFAGFPPNEDRNLVYLLDQMEGVLNRKASFVTVIALVLKGKLFTFEGRLNGEISLKRMGNHGFGYDPVFIPEGFRETFAQMSPERKNAISHRALALQQLAGFFMKNGGEALL
ncbi:MAG: RdgB/HAM1 family non-canonical purine NTP pyrophosphatase [Bacteroidia bacterium]|nr:RdgB/HAM1 family non-canonical purine NTP pyrophosphatase [Bacteroidia bacterium]